jgi:hypothetical protein
MAVTETVVRRTNDEVEVDIIATADADTVTALTNHGLGPQRPTASFIPILQAPAALSLWAVTTLNTTQWQMTKATTMGSGNAGVQVRLTLRRAR